MRRGGGSWALARAHARAERRILVATVLVLCVGGAVGLAGLSAALRAISAFDRFIESAGRADVELYDERVTAGDVRTLAPVEDAGAATYVLLRFPDISTDPNDTSDIVPFAAADENYLRTIERPRIVAGRRASQAAIDEVVVTESLSRRQGFGLGSTVRVQAYSTEAAGRIMEGEESVEPGQPVVETRVVGVMRRPADLLAVAAGQDWVGDADTVYLTRAFYERYAVGQLGPALGLSVRLHGGLDDARAFRTAINDLAGAPDIEIRSVHDRTGKVERAIAFEAAAAAVAGGLVLIATLLVALPSAVRSTRRSAAVGTTCVALGMRPTSAAAASAGPQVVAVSIGAVGAAILAALLSSFTPLGLARLAEPTPGIRIDAAVLGTGALTILVFGVGAIVLASRARADARPALSTRGGLSSPRLPVWAQVGLRFATRSESRATTATTWASMIGAAALGAAALSVGFTVTRVLDNRSEHGWGWAAVLDGAADNLDRVAAVDGVRAAGRGGFGMLSFEGRSVPALALEGPLMRSATVATGRLPAADDEVAIGSSLAAAAGHLGDEIELAGPGGDSASFTIVGHVLVPDGIYDRGGGIGGGVLLPSSSAADLGLEPDDVFVVADADARVTDLVDRLDEEFGGALGYVEPADIRNLGRVRHIPFLVAGFIAALLMAGLVQAALSGRRERRRELAIHHALGMTTASARAAVRVHLSALAGATTVLGLVPGVLLGRWIWNLAATAAGFRPALETPYELALPLTAVAALFGVVAATPGTRGLRSRAAALLRVE